jgi:hypothetical protein
MFDEERTALIFLLFCRCRGHAVLPFVIPDAVLEQFGIRENDLLSAQAADPRALHTHIFDATHVVVDHDEVINAFTKSNAVNTSTKTVPASTVS